MRPSRLHAFTEDCLRVAALRDTLSNVRFSSRCVEEMLITFVFPDPDLASQGEFDVVALGSPPASPGGRLHASDGCEEPSITFLLATYEKYEQPLVWLRSIHKPNSPLTLNLVRSPPSAFGPEGDADNAVADCPLFLQTIQAWGTKTGTPRLYDVLSELYFMCTRVVAMPCEVNWNHDVLREFLDVDSLTPEQCRRGVVVVMGMAATLAAMLFDEVDKGNRVCPDINKLVLLHTRLFRRAGILLI